jgi:hypothetical protein
VEDRVNPGLYLEMTDRTPDAYGCQRVDQVLTVPGVTRGTWWLNEKPYRKEFPRTIPEFTTLGLYEVSEDFEAPDPPEDIRSLHFRRTPRPGQGNLSGKPTLGLELVLLSPKEPESAVPLRDWCDFVHIHHIAAAGVENFTMITPYQNRTGESPLFLHLYEIDTLEAEEAFLRMTPTTQRRRVGEKDSKLYREWFFHPRALLDYVNTFRRIGERIA